MDYRKIIIYILIIAAAFGYWHKLKQDKKAYRHSAETFADVYSSLVVLAELYRNEPERYSRARDSVFSLYNYSSDSLRLFLETYKDDGDRWPAIWGKIRNHSDSLIEYFKTHPVSHPVPDSTDSNSVR